MIDGITILYGLRSKKTGIFVELRKEQNPKNRYACCETSHYAFLPREVFVRKGQSEHDLWLLDSKDAILNALTEDTQYYNADSSKTPVIEFDYEEDEFEIVKLTKQISIETEPLM